MDRITHPEFDTFLKPEKEFANRDAPDGFMKYEEDSMIPPLPHGKPERVAKHRNQMKTVLETERLILRHQVIEDLDDLWALYCNPNITRYIPDAPRSRTEAQEELEWHMHGHPKNRDLGLWATISKETGKFIGRCGLLPWTIEGQYEIEVAYTIAQEYWGQGLATEAARAILQYGFTQLNLARLICLIEPDNLASQRVAEKIGMVFEKESRNEMGLFLIYSIEKKLAT